MKKRQIRELNKYGKKRINGHKPSKTKVFNVSQDKRNRW